jgi:hypothetical protein
MRIWTAKFPIVTNGRGGQLGCTRLPGEADLLVVLFPHPAGLDTGHVEDVGDAVRITARTRMGRWPSFDVPGRYGVIASARTATGSRSPNGTTDPQSMSMEGNARTAASCPL